MPKGTSVRSDLNKVISTLHIALTPVGEIIFHNDLRDIGGHPNAETDLARDMAELEAKIEEAKRLAEKIRDYQHGKVTLRRPKPKRLPV
jgi:hypothetical protein